MRCQHHLCRTSKKYDRQKASKSQLSSSLSPETSTFESKKNMYYCYVQFQAGQSSLSKPFFPSCTDLRYRCQTLGSVLLSVALNSYAQFSFSCNKTGIAGNCSSVFPEFCNTFGSLTVRDFLHGFNILSESLLGATWEQYL